MDAGSRPAAGLSVAPPGPEEAKVYSLLGIEFNPAKPAIEANLNPWVASALIAAGIVHVVARRGW